MNKKKIYSRGFTLIELLVVMGIIAVLAAVALIAINPARQFKLARDSQRTSNVAAILNAVGQNISENKGIFRCGANIPVSSTTMKSSGGYDIASCLVPTYISSLPFDPNNTNAKYDDAANYDTEYSILQDQQGRITVTAIAEIGQNITATR